MLVVWIVSILFFQEMATTLQIAGALVIFAGLALLNVGSPTKKEKVANRPLSRIPWSWVCAVCIAGYHLAYHKALHHGADPRSLFAVGVFSFMSFVIFLYGLQVSAPGFAISLRNSSIFFAIVFSFFLRESLTHPQILGALTVAVGALLLSLP